MTTEGITVSNARSVAARSTDRTATSEEFNNIIDAEAATQASEDHIILPEPYVSAGNKILDSKGTLYTIDAKGSKTGAQIAELLTTPAPWDFQNFWNLKKQNLEPMQVLEIYAKENGKSVTQMIELLNHPDITEQQIEGVVQHVKEIVATRGHFEGSLRMPRGSENPYQDIAAGEKTYTFNKFSQYMKSLEETLAYRAGDTRFVQGQYHHEIILGKHPKMWLPTPRATELFRKSYSQQHQNAQILEKAARLTGIEGINTPEKLFKWLKNVNDKVFSDAVDLAYNEKTKDLSSFLKKEYKPSTPRPATLP
jgi:hypothetical protein